MRWFRNLAIRHKLTLIIMATTSVSLVLACAAFVIHERIAYRRVPAGDLWALAGTILVASLLVAYLLSIKLQRVISGPIQKLARAATAVAERKDFSVRADRLSDDELGLLVTSFNGMLEQIQYRNDALTGSLARLQRAQESIVEQTLDVEKINHELAHTLEALRESEERYSLAARGANDGLWDWDLRSNEVYFSPRWKSMLGLGEGEISNRPEEWLGRVHPEDLARLRAELDAHLQGLTLHFENEHRLIHSDGGFRWILTRGLAVRGRDGKPHRIAGSQTDTTGRKVYDGLTGLPNRMLFLDRLASVLARTKRHVKSLFAVLFLDLDRFKIVNDSLGHTLGDQLLIEVARRLEGCVRLGDTVARMGGDEFAILLEETRDISDATRVAARVHQALAAPCSLDGREVFTSASVGIAMSATGYQSPEHVLQDADTAMYRAKSLGKARYEVFDEAMRERALARLRMESELRRAVEREQFELFYQPIVSLATGRVLGCEALVRWIHPERGLILPEEFIPLAEETGLIVPISDQVLREACRQLGAWLEQLPLAPSFVVSVNVSGKQLAHGDFATRIASALRKTGLPPHRLKLEITESAIVENADSAAGLLRQLKDMGVGIWLDDFGTGYSSFSHLHQFPIDTLKIDSSFINTLEVNGEITRTIVLLAHSLGMDAIAEGVENPGQRDRLSELGCDSVQGYLFSPPLKAADAGELLAGARAWDRAAGAVPAVIKETAG